MIGRPIGYPMKLASLLPRKLISMETPDDVVMKDRVNPHGPHLVWVGGFCLLYPNTISSSNLPSHWTSMDSPFGQGVLVNHRQTSFAIR